MEVYQTDPSGFFVGTCVADPDPLEKGKWLIPAGCVSVKPPRTEKGKIAQWDGRAWKTVSEPKPQSAGQTETIGSLSLPQLLIGLVSDGWITEKEGEAWLSGVALPAGVRTYIAGLPKQDRFAAKVRTLKLSDVFKTDAIVAALALEAKKGAQDIDLFFDTFAHT